MAVKIKFQRRGKKKQPIYRVVVQDSRTARDGKVVEILGIYNPLTEPATIELKDERVKYWLSVGAKPTDSVERILVSQSLMEPTRVYEKKEKVVIKEEEVIEETVTEEAVEEKTEEVATEEPAKEEKVEEVKAEEKAEKTPKKKTEKEEA